MPVSDSSAKDMIEKWRRARLAIGDAQGYSRTNVLHPTWGVGVAVRIEELGATDAERVQHAVDTMHVSMRTVFEAWELGIIAGRRLSHLSQRKRGKALDMDWEVYRRRYNCAFAYVKNHVDT